VCNPLTLLRLSHVCELKNIAYIIGLPHLLREDDIYNGYFIPKGAIILTNIKSVAFSASSQSQLARSDTTFSLYLYRSQFFRDPKRYKNPNTFSPERFLASEGVITETDPREYIFGCGRRSVFPLAFLNVKPVKA
jgi:Cytochrome P450